MKKVRVPVLMNRKYRLPDGRVVQYTPEDSKNIVTQGNRQIKSNLSVPLSWMHDPDAEPAYLSNSARTKPKYHEDAWIARGYFGDVDRYELNQNGGVDAICTIYDDKDAAQFEKVGRVSPALVENFIDEKGVRWPGVTIMHIASTPKPVQRDIPRVTPAYLSQSSKFHNIQLLSHKAKISEVEMADEVKDAKNSGEGQSEKIGKLVELLKKAGLSLGSPSNWDELFVAAEAAVETKHGETMLEEDLIDDMDDMDDELEYEGEEDTEVASPPVMMSAIESKFVKESLKKKFEDRKSKIEKLASKGVIGSEYKSELLNQNERELQKAESVNLSIVFRKKFDKEGDLKKTKLDIVIETLAKVPETRFGKKVNLSHTAKVAKPSDDGKDASKKEAMDFLEHTLKSKKGDK